MKKPLLTFLLIITGFSIYSQTENDIVWQIETAFEYQLEKDSVLNFQYENKQNEVFGSKSKVETVKIDPTKYINSANYSLRGFLISSVEKGLFSAYTIDENKKIPTRKIGRLLSPVDTIFTFHPETGKEIINVFVNDFNTSYIQSLIIKQSWSFNQTTNQLYSKVIGIIPVIHKKGVKKKLFWIPLNNEPLTEPFDFNAPNFTWVKLSEDIISFDEAKVLKGENSKWLEKTLLEKVRNGAIEGLDPVGGNPFYKAPLSERELDIMLNPQIDTIIEFNPQTMEEKISIHEMKGIKATDIIGLKIFQYWFIDVEKNTLNNQLIAFSPIIEEDSSSENKFRIKIPFRINFY